MKRPRTKVLLSLITIGVVLILIRVGYALDWTGLSEYTQPSPNIQRAKTLWDWLDLLIVPAVLALGALWFNRQQRTAEHKLEVDRLRESVLQKYLDHMTELLLKEGLRTSEQGSDTRQLARARTLTTLRRLDGKRKATLMQFLLEAKLIVAGDAIIDLRGADLREVDLSEIFFCYYEIGVHLRDTNLTKANLRNANLGGAYLYGANLNKANLSGAFMGGTDLRCANLSEADLSKTVLRDADLLKADFTGANLSQADLQESNLTGAIVSDEQLKRAKSLKDAILANGTKYTES